ncbi:MAG TPA: PQQ-binding-like beta-propeller repeat protein [Tepidisphaeraceae bacterium]|nr:PQQ-binding-like beta-propeller repeat protein [Tepidisphaeraceae bacterium]
MRTLLTITCVALLASSLRADDWPNYRGPHHDGTSSETGWTTQWPPQGPPVLWKANVGTGLSSFAVGGGRAYTAGNTDNTDTIFCLDSNTGKVIWKHSYPSDLGAKFFDGGTTATPTLDNKRLYVIGRWGDLFSFDAASGKVIWQENIHTETKIRVPGWGFSGSPLVMGDLLVLNVGEAGVAVNKRTGRIIWKSASKDAGYSTPVPMSADGKSLVVLSNALAILAVDLQTGKQVWKMRWVTQYGANAADPIVNGDRVLISSAYGKGAALLQSAEGEPKILWKSKVLRSHLNPGVPLGEFVYGFDGDKRNDASLKCIEFATGKEKWSAKESGVGSLIIADGKLIVLNENGELVIAPASPDGFKPIAHAQILGGTCWTSPVLSGGRIFCRNSRGDVVCLNVRGSDSDGPHAWLPIPTKTMFAGSLCPRRPFHVDRICADSRCAKCWARSSAFVPATIGTRSRSNRRIAIMPCRGCSFPSTAARMSPL